nr:hypothetical protein CFP56_30126 [Quercus suber]
MPPWVGGHGRSTAGPHGSPARTPVQACLPYICGANWVPKCFGALHRRRSRTRRSRDRSACAVRECLLPYPPRHFSWTLAEGLSSVMMMMRGLPSSAPAALDSRTAGVSRTCDPLACPGGLFEVSNNVMVDAPGQACPCTSRHHSSYRAGTRLRFEPCSDHGSSSTDSPTQAERVINPDHEFEAFGFQAFVILTKPSRSVRAERDKVLKPLFEETHPSGTYPTRHGLQLQRRDHRRACPNDCAVVMGYLSLRLQHYLDRLPPQTFATIYTARSRRGGRRKKRISLASAAEKLQDLRRTSLPPGQAHIGLTNTRRDTVILRGVVPHQTLPFFVEMFPLNLAL